MEMETISLIVDTILHYVKALGSFISPIALCPTKKSSITLTIFILTSTNFIQALILSPWGIVLRFLLASSPSSIPLAEQTMECSSRCKWFPRSPEPINMLHGKREWSLHLELSLLVSRPWYGRWIWIIQAGPK